MNFASLNDLRKKEVRYQSGISRDLFRRKKANKMNITLVEVTIVEEAVV